MMQFQHIQASDKLPAAWDQLAENYFQRRKFLSHAESYNPCKQRYYIGTEEGKTRAAAIVYSLRLDLLTFAGIKSPLRMNIVGIPCSVSSQGIFGEALAVEQLKRYLLQEEKGLLLFLNLKKEEVDGSCPCGRTFPNIILENRYHEWEDYLAALRSHYRRRLSLINSSNGDLKFEQTSCSGFTKEMYELYLEVYRRSKGKLERLSFEFFKNLPAEFTLCTCYSEKKILGWNIGLESGDAYYFFLGGIDYKYNKSKNTYLRLLSRLVRDGIEKNARIIDLGQTAETPKMRMGGKAETLYLEAHHSNWFLDRLIGWCSSLLEYKAKPEETNALKKEVL